MRTLTNEQYAPITSQVGFLELPLDRVTNGCLAWIRQNGVTAEAVGFHELFPEVLHRVEPLRGGPRVRQLFVETRSPWTAYFDSGIDGSDATGVVRYLARTLRCRGVTATAQPHTIDQFHGRCGRYGAVQFQLFGPDETEFMNYVRTVYAQHDGSRWVFDADGTPQPFEMPERYKARRVPERFTSEMLELYCRALGIDVFDVSFYGPRAVLVRSELATSTARFLPPVTQIGGATVRTVSEPVDMTECSLAEVQRRRCIGPGAEQMLDKMRVGGK